MTDEQFQQLKRYKELLDVGVLAPNEYERLKARFLQVEMIALDLEQAQKPQPITESRNKSQARQKGSGKWIQPVLYCLILLILLLGGYAYLQWHHKTDQTTIQTNEKNAITKITATTTDKQVKSSSSSSEKQTSTSSESTTSESDLMATVDASSVSSVEPISTAVDASSAESALAQNDTSGVAWTYQNSTANGFVFVGPTNEDGSYAKALVTDRTDGQNVEIRTGTVDADNSWSVSDDVTVPWQ